MKFYTQQMGFREAFVVKDANGRPTQVEPWKVNPRTLTLRTGDEIEEAAFCQDRIQPYMQDLSHHRNTR